MILLNFAHPLTDEQLAAVERLAGAAIARVIEVRSQVDAERPLAPQVAAMADAAGLTPAEWQSASLLVNPPSLNYSAAALMAELHGRMGYFPACLRLRPVAGAVPPRFEVAEILNLNDIRSEARLRRWGRAPGSECLDLLEEAPMLDFTGHPLVDVGIATIVAYAGKRGPAELTEADLEAIADYMSENYVVNPLKSFLTVAFPNSGFTQPAFEKTPERRQAYAARVLRAFRAGTPELEGEPCVFTGRPAVALAFGESESLPPGRAFRQHIPLLTGEGVVNFHPYGNAGLPVSGVALLAIQAFPLGCAKVKGRLLAVHADDPALTLSFARRFLETNRKLVLDARLAGESKLPEPPHRVGTLLVGTLLEIETGRIEAGEEPELPSSVTAYHLSNSGQSPDLAIYQLPLEIGDFLRNALSATYRAAWDALRQRAWEITQAKGKRAPAEAPPPRYNTLYEDLLRLPEGAASFVRTYFLRIPRRRVQPGDPRATYSLRTEAGLVSWGLTELFLRKVVRMNKERIDEIRTLGDALAGYVHAENDRRLFHTLLTANRYGELRAALIKASQAQVRRGKPPLVTFDRFITVFEMGEELPYQDWRLARDLVLIRTIEELYGLGWLQAHAEELPEPELNGEEE